MNSLLTSLPAILPIVCAWAEKREEMILEEGIPLGESQLVDARHAGVLEPERIRVVRVEALPHPENDEVMFLAKQISLFSPRSRGLTIGYGIYLHQECWEDRYRLVHARCVHVGQYEKLEGIRPFLSAYLRECIEPGHPFGRLEQEAILIARDICKESAESRQTALLNFKARI